MLNIDDDLMSYRYKSEIIQKYLGKTIDSIEFDDSLKIIFDDGLSILIVDSGQSCCEERFMTTDCDYSSCQNEKLIDIEIVSGHLDDSNWIPPDDFHSHKVAHEVAFLKIKTNKDSYTFETHNDHNGYYGGFTISVYEGSE